MKIGTLSAFLLAAAFVAGVAISAQAADPAAKTETFKQWTLTCVTPPADQGSATKPQPFCRILHEVHPANDQTKTVLIATTRFFGKERTRAMVLRLPPVANLQQGVVFSIDKNPAFKAKISSCTAELCISLFQISDEVLKQLKSGQQMFIAFALTNGAQQAMKLTLPLDGYAQAFDALQKTGL